MPGNRSTDAAKDSRGMIGPRMDRPDFRKLNEMIAALTGVTEHFYAIYADRDARLEEIRTLCEEIRRGNAGRALAHVSVEELKKSRAGIRVSVLQEAGYEDLAKLAAAADWELRAIDGIGEKQIEAIRGIIATFTGQLAARETVTLSDEESTAADANGQLIRALCIYRRGELLRRDGENLLTELQGFHESLLSRGIIRNRVRWLFSGKAQKLLTLRSVEEIVSFLDSPVFERLTHYIVQYREITGTRAADAFSDFRTNAASYYALLEQIGGEKPSGTLLYESIPEQLAASVDAFSLDLSGFSGSLRAYQEFGAKYILHQGRVLLGDEMGLGKTIQAIAVMTHLQAAGPGAHFLIVCPASVLVNWCRELQNFSTIRPFLLHGNELEPAFLQWQGEGGAAVTNYESMGKIVDRINNRMRLSLLVIDEAHYIKNPEAQRTRHIRMLDEESERILLMTGTPLENHVEEMCSLIDFIRPDLSREIRGMAQLSHAPQFRELLSPVYLRRTREQVLRELPPVEEEQEWCAMTETDRRAYVEAVRERNFTAMRRVSFLQGDAAGSSKMNRLLELCGEGCKEGRRILVFSFFRETIAAVAAALGETCFGVITGDVPFDRRQALIDRFSREDNAGVLVCQIQAGGTGLNIQAASIVIFCEPQIKPSLEKQALSRVYRMGQVRNVLVYRLLCADSVDEAIVRRLREKEEEFDAFADRSVMAQATEDLLDREWIRDYIEEENRKYLPMVI